MNQSRTTRQRRRRGNAMMEGALVMTSFMMILFGIMEFSRAVFDYNTSQFAAREGARFASVRGTNSGNAATTTDVRNYVLSRMPGVPADDVTVTTTWTPDKMPGSMVSVQVTTAFRPIAPFLPTGTWNLQGVSQMSISQ